MLPWATATTHQCASGPRSSRCVEPWAPAVATSLVDASVEVVLVMSKAVFCALLCALAACATDSIHVCMVSS